MSREMVERVEAQLRLVITSAYLMCKDGRGNEAAAMLAKRAVAAIAAMPPAGRIARVRLETLCGSVTGVRYLDVLAVEKEDDGTLTAVVAETGSGK